MKPAMYIFINKGLRMSAGKIAAQAGHAAVEAYRETTEKAKQETSDSSGFDHRTQRLIDEWYKGGHYAKYVMEARDDAHMRNIKDYLEARDFKTVLIIDEGHTEVPPLSATALGVELVDKDDPHTAATFSSFQLFKEPRPAPPNEEPFKDEVRQPRTYEDPAQEPPGAKRVPGGDGGFVREPKPRPETNWFEKYLSDPAKALEDLERAKTVIDNLRPPRR